MQVVQDGINAAHEHPKSVLCLGVCVCVCVYRDEEMYPFHQVLFMYNALWMELYMCEGG